MRTHTHVHIGCSDWPQQNGVTTWQWWHRSQHDWKVDEQHEGVVRKTTCWRWLWMINVCAITRKPVCTCWKTTAADTCTKVQPRLTELILHAQCTSTWGRKDTYNSVQYLTLHSRVAQFGVRSKVWVHKTSRVLSSLRGTKNPPNLIPFSRIFGSKIVVQNAG